VPDALDSRSQLRGEFSLHRILQAGEAVVAQFHGKPYDGCSAGGGLFGELGHGAERDRLRLGQHDFGGPEFSRGEVGDSSSHLFCEGHTADYGRLRVDR